MLILMRRRGEAIRIGDTIIVTVLGLSGSSVRIGIEAPRDICVDREEVHQRKKAGNRLPDGRGSEGFGRESSSNRSNKIDTIVDRHGTGR